MVLLDCGLAQSFFRHYLFSRLSMNDQNLTRALCAAAMLAFGGNALSQSTVGDPLPQCPANTEGFYAFNISGSGSAAQLITLTASGAGVQSQVAYGAGSESTAVGMHPQNGYLYGVRTLIANPINNPEYLEVIKYGASGFENLGPVQGMPAGYDRYPYFNSADIAPDGFLYIAKFFVDQTVPGGNHGEILKISLANDQPTYVATIALTPGVGEASAPGVKPVFSDVSQDFAIDASGQYAYGLIEKFNPALGAVRGRVDAYRIDLATGAVTFDQNFANVREFSYQGTARLPGGDYAITGKNGDYRLMSNLQPLGTSDQWPGGVNGSGDAASCIAAPIPPDVAAVAVPTLGTTMLVALSGLIGAAGLWRRRRRSAI